MYSGGIGSWAAAMRVAEQKGTDDLILLFTDTKKRNDLHPHRGEDQDLYRFLQESVPLVGAKLEWVSRGKHIWQVFEDTRYMGNTRVDPCSRELKREMARQWIEERFTPEEVTLYIGIDWTEGNRVKTNTEGWAPYHVEFPMFEAPYLSKEEMCEWAESLGVQRPRLYHAGFAHNNCGGFCVKAGQGHFYRLLKVMPERYAYHEAKQEELFLTLGKRTPFLRQKVDGVQHYLSLREFREQIETAEMNGDDVSCKVDLEDIGGCGCFGYTAS